MLILFSIAIWKSKIDVPNSLPIIVFLRLLEISDHTERRWSFLFSRWGSSVHWYSFRLLRFWSSWETVVHKGTHSFPLTCSSWFTGVLQLYGLHVCRAPLPGTQTSGRESATWCLLFLSGNIASLLLFKFIWMLNWLCLPWM